MSLSALIRKGGLAKAATATTATLATQGAKKAGTVAIVATVAVANPPEWQPATPASKQPAPSRQISGFAFSPPGDPANDDEALQERRAILAVENGWNDATALQDARWQADRERAWRAFLRNAARILAVPAHEREDLLMTYQAEAVRRYGEPTGTDMAKSLESWVRARGVH